MPWFAINARVALLLHLMVLSGWLLCQTTVAAKQPNIIFILADDLGYGDLGCYGQKKIQTPHIDKLAAEGMRFTDFYAGSTVCAPSRCVLMTGLHSGHCWIRGNSRRSIRPEDVTIAEVLQEAGYKTALCGKWGLGEEGTHGVPNKQGFDFFYGYLNQHHAHNYYPAYLFRNDKRESLANVVPGDGPFGRNVASKKIEYSHNKIMEEALGFIEREHESPFFLYLALTIPHANNEAGTKGMEVPELGQYADKDWPEPQKGLAAMISLMDTDIGRLREKLQELKIDDNTIIFFTSDNGPHREGGNDPHFADSNGPLRGIKRDLYEGGIRVPMIVHWPGKIKPGTTSEFVGAAWDFFPTAVELSEAKPTVETDGVSIVPTLLGRPGQQRHDSLYWEFHEGGTKQAVRSDMWKLVRLKVGNAKQFQVELYDLSQDIGEENNIAADHPEVVERLLGVLKNSRRENPFWEIED